MEKFRWMLVLTNMLAQEGGWKRGWRRRKREREKQRGRDLKLAAAPVPRWDE